MITNTNNTNTNTTSESKELKSKESKWIPTQFLTLEIDVSEEFSTLIHGDRVKDLVLRGRTQSNTYDMFDIDEIHYPLEQYRKFIHLLACRQNPILSNKIEVECVVSKKETKHSYLFNPIVKYLNTLTYHDKTITPVDDSTKYSYEYITSHVNVNNNLSNNNKLSNKPIQLMYEYSKYSNFEFYKKYSFLDSEFAIRQNLILLAMFDFLYGQADSVKTHNLDVFEPLNKMQSIEIIDGIPFINREKLMSDSNKTLSINFPAFYHKMLKLTSQYEHDRWYSHVIPTFMIDTVKEFCEKWKIEIHPVSFSVNNNSDIVYYMRFSDLYNYPFNHNVFDLTLINYVADNKTISVPMYVHDVDKFNTLLSQLYGVEDSMGQLVSEFLNMNSEIMNKNNTFNISNIEMFIFVSNIINM
jgi:hypothetical protein